MRKTNIVIIVTTVFVLALLTIGVFIGRATVQPTVIKETVTEVHNEVQEKEVKVHTVESKGTYSNSRIFDDDGNVFEVNVPSLTEDTRVLVEYDTHNTLTREDDEVIGVSPLN